MKVLCCLLSDQHVPNLLSVHHFQPDRLVLIESERMRRRNAAQNFLDALKCGKLDYTERCDVVPHGDVSDFATIAESLRNAFGKHPTGNWIVNLTGGTKPMSIVAYELFRALGARLIYIDIAKPRQILYVNTGETETISYSLSIEEFLLGYGFRYQKPIEQVRAAERYAKDWFACAARMARMPPSKSLLKIGDRKRWNHGRESGLTLQAGELNIADPVLRETIRETFNLRVESSSLTGPVNSYAVRFLTGGWLEVFLWGLLDRYQNKLEIWDVRLGVVPVAEGSNTGNDFDVAFMRDYALHMIECKTGSQKHDRDVDALYKIEAVIRQFRALRVHSYLATTSANLLDDNGNIKPSVRDRASLYNCRFLTTPDIQKLAGSADDHELLQQLLFGRPGNA